VEIKALHGVVPEGMPSIGGGGCAALQALRGSLRKPFFDGNLQHWQDFVVAWQHYARYMLLGAPEGQAGDLLRRDTLVSCLSGALWKRWSGELRLRPTLTFDEVWSQLARAYEVDDPHTERRRWHEVRLQHSGGTIRLQEFLTFTTEFNLALQQVADLTDQEVLDLILKQLPEAWRTKVMRAEQTAMEKEHALKYTGPELTEQELLNVLRQLGVRSAYRVRRLKGCTLVQLRDESEKMRLADARGLLVKDCAVSFRPTRCRWTSDNIFDYIVKELQLEQESKVLSGLPSVSHSPSREPSHGEGRGRKGGRWNGRTHVREVTFEQDSSTDVPQTETDVYAVKGKGQGKGKKPQPPTYRGPPCWTCRDLGLDAAHFHGTCKRSLARKEELRKSREKENTPAPSFPHGNKSQKGAKGKGKGGSSKDRKGKGGGSPPPSTH
jgi:hypothetical protein